MDSRLRLLGRRTGRTQAGGNAPRAWPCMGSAESDLPPFSHRNVVRVVVLLVAGAFRAACAGRSGTRPGWASRLRRWRSVAQRTVRPDGVVVAPPLLDQHFCLPQCVEDLAIEQLVPELAVKALVVAVLQGEPGSMNRVLTPTRGSQSRTT